MYTAKYIRGKQATGGDSTLAYTAMTDGPDVVALWNFEETTGSTFTDSVNSVDVTVYNAGGSANEISYGVDSNQTTDGGRHSNVAPGLTHLDVSTLQNPSGLDATLSPGTGSFTIEFYIRNMSVVNPFYMFSSLDTAGGSSYSILAYVGSTLGGFFRVKATDGTLVSLVPSAGTLPNTYDGEIHHFAFKYDAGNTLSMDIDGVEEASISAASLSGKSVEFDGVALMGLINNSGQRCPWTVYQCRISHAVTNGYEVA